LTGGTGPGKLHFVGPDLHFYRLAQLIAFVVHGIGQGFLYGIVRIIEIAVGFGTATYLLDVFLNDIVSDVGQSIPKLYMQRPFEVFLAKPFARFIFPYHNLNPRTGEEALRLLTEKLSSRNLRRFSPLALIVEAAPRIYETTMLDHVGTLVIGLQTALFCLYFVSEILI